MYKFASFLFTLMLISCSANISFSRLDTTYKPYKKANLIFDKRLDFKPIKMLSHVNNIFVISSQSHLYIYKDKKMINKVGGIGFSNANFSKISDFAVTQNIAVLDELQRVIKLFDFDGNWLIDINLDNFLHPTLFDVSESGVYYIYDKDRDEISVSAHPSKQIDFTFGKFMLNKPVRLSISDNYLVINNEDGSSDIFDLSGQLLKHESKNIQINRFGKYILNKNFIFQENLLKPIFSSPNIISFFNVTGNYLTAIAGNRAVSIELYYE